MTSAIAQFFCVSNFGTYDTSLFTGCLNRTKIQLSSKILVESNSCCSRLGRMWCYNKYGVDLFECTNSVLRCLWKYLYNKEWTKRSRSYDTCYLKKVFISVLKYLFSNFTEGTEYYKFVLLLTYKQIKVTHLIWYNVTIYYKT